MSELGERAKDLRERILRLPYVGEFPPAWKHEVGLWICEALLNERQQAIEECAALVTAGCWTHGPDIGVDVKIARAIRALLARPEADRKEQP